MERDILLDGVAPQARCWVLRSFAERLSPSDPILGWNVARERARAILGDGIGENAPYCGKDVPQRYSLLRGSKS